MKKQWCIPKQYSGEFVARMEDILAVYAMPRDENCPLVCMDEQPVQLLGERYTPIAAKPGKIEKKDYQYTRNGTCSIFIFTAPHENWRHVTASEHRTKQDWAHQIEHLLEVDFPNAPKIRLVQDNLNTHSISSLYETFPPQKAFALAKRLEIHFTPKHGSWLNIAEIELSVLTKQCLERRIPTIELLQKQLSSWEATRNANARTVNWHFSIHDARGKLQWLYPKI